MSGNTARARLTGIYLERPRGARTGALGAAVMPEWELVRMVEPALGRLAQLTPQRASGTMENIK